MSTSLESYKSLHTDSTADNNQSFKTARASRMSTYLSMLCAKHRVYHRETIDVYCFQIQAFNDDEVSELCHNLCRITQYNEVYLQRFENVALDISG